MIYQIKTYNDIDERKLMDVYGQSNLENIDYFYPNSTNKKDDLKKVEEDYLDYLKNDFFARKDSSLWILEVNNKWVSALRLYQIKSDLYYLEALETHPDYRKKGYGSMLLSGLISELSKYGSFKLYANVGKKNISSLKTHEKCGFVIISDKGYDYVYDEYYENDYELEFEYLKK